jgi:hypothetical protein
MTSSAHRRRLQNLADVHVAVGPEAPWHTIQDYLPGQVVYNLGEYPARFSIAPTEYDAELLTRLAEAGVELIQIHEDWNDSERVLGADKFTSHDPAGLQQFVDLAHGLGLKALPYISSGFFDIRDPDFREEFYDPARSRLIELYFDYARCSPASPEWRAYLLPRVERLLDQYGFDGLYNDVGYHPDLEDQPVAEGQVRPAPWPHAAFEDLLGLLYDMAHRRGGVVKMHGGPPRISERVKLYDYLWLGEGVESLDKLRLEARAAPHYVVPCPDMSRAQVVDEHDLYRYAIPFMQFPLRVDGRPFTGERAGVPGVAYQPEATCFWTRHCRAIHRHYQEHPEGPYTYGWWDSCPGRPEARDIWLDYLRLYRPMVAPGSRVWMELRQGALFAQPPPGELAVSLFANTEAYLVAANFGATDAVLSSTWVWCDRRSRREGANWTLAPREMLFLQRVES